MKNKWIYTLVVLVWLAANNPLPAAEKGDPKVELKDLVDKVRLKMRAGKPTEKDLADEFKQFDALLAAHKDEKTDDVAQILVIKAVLYLQVLENEEKGIALLKQVKTDFPDTRPGKQVDTMLEGIAQQAAGKKIQQSLVEGAKFPDFDEKDTTGKSLSVANYKGKVVLVDFWATWCGPCVGELPNVIKTYEKHHGKGFEIIGISLDQDSEKMTKFMHEKNMTWQQYFDGKGWGNKLAGKYGVNSIPATFLLDGDGKIIGKDLRGEDLEAAVAKALTKK